MNYMVKTTWTGTPEALIVNGTPFRAQFVDLPKMRKLVTEQPGYVSVSAILDPSHTKIVSESIFNSEEAALAFKSKCDFSNPEFASAIIDLAGLKKYVIDHQISVVLEVLPIVEPAAPIK